MKSEEHNSAAGQGLIHTVFESQVRLTPNLCAVEAGDKRLTYLELDQNANRVAGSLLALGIWPEQLVGVCLPRSIALIVGLIGILKAGGVYVPLDPALSKEQLAFMIKDAKLSIIVTEQHSLKQLTRTGAQVICLDPDGWPKTIEGSTAREIPIEEAPKRATGMSPANLAYVNFTSGSTGVPKGVCIPHRGVVRLVKGTNYARFSSQDVFLHSSSICFDASTFEIWGCLLNGGRLVIFRAGLPLISELSRVIQSKGVTTLWLTSGFFNRVVDLNVISLRGIRQLLIGGDALSVPHVQKALDALEGCQLINGYGPTENTTFTCCYQIRSPINGDSIPIGQPITNTYVHILGSDGQPVSPGALGELYIGGAGLARSYLNRPDLTARKFVRDPFSSSIDARLFKSGDRVRSRADGNIEFVGRLDRQVKVRGFRIELDGVEAALRRCRTVQQAAVATRGKDGSKRLVAYVVLKPGCLFDSRQLRKQLRTLPYYAVPGTFVPLSELPLTENGKTDYAALPVISPGAGLPVCGGERSNLTTTQAAVSELWNEALRLMESGLDDDFFDLGGDSLQLVTLLAWVERRFNKTLSLSDCVEARTIRKLADVLDNAPPSNLDSPSFVVALREAGRGARAPLFLAAGAAGSELQCYLHLASQFPEDQAIYGLQSPAVVERKLATIESMAAHHLRVLREVQGSGPYYLGGFCFGALVAFEMAQQLSAQAEEVRFLGIIDYSANALDARQFRWAPQYQWRWFKNLAYAATDLWDSPPDERKRCIQRWVARVRYYCAQKFNSRDPSAAGNLDFMWMLARAEEMPEELVKRTQAEYKAWRDYEPRAYTGPVTLFRPRRLPIFQPYDETLGWSRFARGRLDVCVVPGPGFHGYMMSPASASGLAKLLARCLTAAQSAASPPCLLTSNIYASS